MSWSIAGTYFETCSCELMCPCNFSFAHGATYDYCRATMVFNNECKQVNDPSREEKAAIASTARA